MTAAPFEPVALGPSSRPPVATLRCAVSAAGYRLILAVPEAWSLPERVLPCLDRARSEIVLFAARHARGGIKVRSDAAGRRRVYLRTRLDRPIAAVPIPDTRWEGDALVLPVPAWVVEGWAR